jgi:DNA-binding LacI/PurR family transcriptional regulator
MYREIAKRLLARIKKRQWPVGHQLPSNSQLATEHQASRLTLQRALACLGEDGKITRTPQGKWKVGCAERAFNLYSNRVVLILSSNLTAYWKNIHSAHYLIRKGIEMGLGEKRRQLQIIARYWYNKKVNQTVMPGLLDENIHGVLLQGVFTKPCQREYSALKMPVVLVDTPSVTDRLASVCVANEAAAHDAVQRLAHLGHRRIAFCRRLNITMAEVDPDSMERQHGFLSGLKSCGISNGKEAIFNFMMTGGNADTASLRAIFATRPRYTAALTVDSQVATVFARSAQAAGMILPRDLAIASFSESDSAWSGPRIDFERVGREAVELLDSHEIKQIRIPATWYEGSTLGDPLSVKR